jgi:hypothetical protein
MTGKRMVARQGKGREGKAKDGKGGKARHEKGGKAREFWQGTARTAPESRQGKRNVGMHSKGSQESSWQQCMRQKLQGKDRAARQGKGGKARERR